MGHHQQSSKLLKKLQASRRLIPAQGGIQVRPKVEISIEKGLAMSRLLFAHAPKGYGKTLSTGAYARKFIKQGGAAEWVELSGEAIPVEAFLCYLVDAVSKLLELPDASIERIQTEMSSGWRDALEVFLLGMSYSPTYGGSASSSAKVQSGANVSDKLLIINGWNSINGGVDQRYILETLIRFTPANLKIIIISSQQDAELLNSPVMINIQPQLLHYIDFSMGYSDVVTRLQQLSIPDAEERARHIMVKTFGWPLAVEVMAKDASVNCYTEEPDESVLLSRLSTFLAEQFSHPVLSQVPHLLAILALVERISGAFCKDVFGEVGQQCFQVLKERLILQQPPEDETSGYYLFNPVFRSWLVETHLKASSPQELEPWLVESSEWFVDHKAFSEAIHLCTYLGKPDVILSVAERSCDYLMQQHGFHQLKRLESLLSQSVVNSSPKLRMAMAWAWAYAMDFETSLKWLDTISQEESDQAELTPLIVLIRAWCSRYQGRYDIALELLERYKTLGSNLELTEAMYLTLSARIALVQGNVSDGEQLVNSSLRKARNWSDSRLESAALIDLCRVHQLRGDWHAALASLDKGIGLLHQQTLGTQTPFYGRMMMLKAFILWIQGDWINAENICDRGIKAALHNEDPLIVLGFSVKAMLYRSRKAFRKAHRSIFELERLMHCWNVPDNFYQSLISLVKAFLKLDEGQVSIAQSLYSELMNRQNWHPALLEWLPHVTYYLDILGIRLQCHHGQWPEALDACDHLQKALSEASRPVMLVPVMVLQSTCYEALGEKKEEVKLLRRALTESMNCNYIAPFMELGGQVAPMLAKLNERGELGEFIYRLQHLEGLREHLNIGNDVCVPLSDREHGVLELIAEGHSNQAVADKLFISLNTVKTHARKINTKLGVKNRTQAIAKARELGIL
ncbi:LuxR C-terminal-related transcriptional regulator [Litoribacillus peritrichatus]|uniref:Helix-turn-helix transcriptional regulator n=1 Tax=Litoribacillus peritrichatus TaxID=718191 RepID=A0ABP7N8I1_9GAMM